jgi:PAS domain S-box-containing protein
MPAPLTTPLGVVYVGIFLLSGIACLYAIPRARRFADTEIRYGMMGLLGLTGLWALLKASYLVVPTTFQPATYIVGLVSGFGAVWAWLYFASAYTGRSLHRSPTLRRVSATVFLGITLLKLTNPIHKLYFTTTEVTAPFQYLAIDHGLIHWVSTSLSYVLAAIGLFMIFELYVESGYDAKPLSALTALLGLPVALDLFAIATPYLIDFIYAPLGVAAFALGVLFVFSEQFLAIQTEAQGDAATILLNDDGRIEAYSSAAANILPELEGATGAYLENVLPAVEPAEADDDSQVLTRDGDDGPRYYLLSRRSMTLSDTTVRVVGLVDITESERQRRDLVQRERELAERNELYRAVISASFAFVFRIETDGTMSFVSPSIEDFLGYDPEHLTGEPVSVMGPDDQAVREAYEALGVVINEGESTQVRELPVETRSGETVHVDVRAEPIYEPDVESDARTTDDIVGVQAMARDASGRRKREAMISVINRVLRHNVRNELTTIKGYAEMLAADLDGDDAVKANRIVDAGDRLLNLSESARRIESHRELSPELKPLDITPVIRDSVARLKDEYSTVSVTTALPETAVARTAPQVRTALWELLDNAAQHTGAEPAIDIEVSATDERVLVRIRDGGSGLPDPEQQVLTTGEEEPLAHGQGLGLFLTHWIITNLGGSVSVTTADRGTVVEVRLPAASAVTTVDTQPQAQ